GAELDLFEDADDLRFTESGFLHAETSVGVDSLLLSGAKIRGGFTGISAQGVHGHLREGGSSADQAGGVDRGQAQTPQI
uniref:hypothetical protein n=1 Tax=Comamonas thiooxydans TaxID=363952 RepID=UPI001C0ECD95